MINVDKKSKQTLSALLSLIAPKGMTAKERAVLARQAGINPETLRTMLRRQTVNADTLIRLLIARGVSPQTLENLPQTESKQMPPGEVEWLELGRELSETEKKEFAGLIRYLLIKWQLKAK